MPSVSEGGRSPEGRRPAGRDEKRPRRPERTGLAALLALAAAALGAAGPEEAPKPHRPTTRTTNCFEGDCHAAQRDHRFLHGPTAIGACDPCHVHEDVQKHTFRLKREGADLCGFCHVGKQTGRYIHQPVLDGTCVDCHDPHGAENRELLPSATVGELCGACHADVVRGRKHAHGPVGSGNCAACHNSHAAEHPDLLVDEGRDFCLGCHKEMGEQMDRVQFVHQPAEGQCSQCHNSHASNHPMQLIEDPLPLCLSCHPQVHKEAIEAPYRHTVVVAGEACLNCHTSHGSDLARLMQSNPIDACLECHDQPTVNPAGQIVPAVAEIADPDLVKHGPIRDGNCSGCHELHGSEVSRLLSMPYPDTFYQPYETRKYALCFNCHEEQLAALPRTEGLTRFRNGDLNLHHLHVNKPERGRSCRACHSTHASKFPVHIRETVPYGQWEMPIDFTPTETGGTCTPGCHREAAYDRVTAAPPPDRQPPPIPPTPEGAPASGPPAGTAATAAGEAPPTPGQEEP